MNVEKWTDAALDRMRTIGDPEADEAVAKVDEIPGSVEQVSLFLSNLIQNDTSILGPDAKVEIPRAIKDFIATHSTLPHWADPVKIELGQRVFMRHGPAALAGLLCASLPECYSHKNGTQVLWYTQNLEEHTVRRVYQTALILLDVMRPPSRDGKDPGGLDVGGAGVLSSVKTRLFHAAMRHLILTRPGPEAAPRSGLAGELLHSDWNEEAWGKPINAEDATFTLLTFSYVILRSWDRLGCSLSSAEREGYIHCWNVVGYFLGIPVDLLPTSWEDAELGFKRLQEHQQAGSPEGVKLTDALRTVIGKIVPNATLATHIDHTLMRFLMSDRTADLLNVPHPDALDHVITLGIQLARIANEGLAAIGSILHAIRWPWGHHESEGESDNLGVMIGQAITDLLVALVGRGEHGYTDDVKASASGVLAASSQASDPILEEITPVLRADSSPEAKQGVSSELGRALMAHLVGAEPDPTIPPRRRAPGEPPPLKSGPPSIPVPKRRFVPPPEFQTGAWKA